MGTYYVYILESEQSGRLYRGQTDDLEERLARHNGNRVPATRGRGPWRLLGYWKVKSRSEAMRLEYYLKGLKNPRAVRELLKQYPDPEFPPPIPQEKG